MGERVGEGVYNATRAAAGEARIEASNNACVRVRLGSLRVVDVQPWSGPVGVAMVVSVCPEIANGYRACARVSSAQRSC